MARAVSQRIPHLPAVPSTCISLTGRESQVLACLVEGHPYEAIAATLSIRLGTVQSHVKSIYRKLGVNSRKQAVASLGAVPR